MARETGLEPATSGVTGRRSNQLSYSRVTRMCPRGTRGDLKGGHGEVKDVALTGSKRRWRRARPYRYGPDGCLRARNQSMVLQALQAISGDIWFDRRLARFPERKTPEEIQEGSGRPRWRRPTRPMATGGSPTSKRCAGGSCRCFPIISTRCICSGSVSAAIRSGSRRPSRSCAPRSRSARARPMSIATSARCCSSSSAMRRRAGPGEGPSRCKPNFPMALTNLGNTLMHLGMSAGGARRARPRHPLKPDYADAYCNRGMVAAADPAESERPRKASIARCRFNPQPSCRRCSARASSSIEPAPLRCRRSPPSNAALAMKPGTARSSPSGGGSISGRCAVRQGGGRFRRGARDRSALEVALRGKAHIGVITDKIAQAMAACNKVLEQQSAIRRSRMAWLGACFAKQGEIATAHRSISIGRWRSSRTTRMRSPRRSSRSISCPTSDFAEHAGGARNTGGTDRRQDSATADCRPRDLDPERRIVVGYVSADFRRHSAAMHLHAGAAPSRSRAVRGHLLFLLAACRTSMTEECRSLADRWVDAWQLSGRTTGGPDRGRSSRHPGRPVRPFRRQPARRCLRASPRRSRSRPGARHRHGPADHGLHVRGPGPDSAEAPGTCLRKRSTICRALITIEPPPGLHRRRCRCSATATSPSACSTGSTRYPTRRWRCGRG